MHMFWPSIWSRYPEQLTMNQTARKLKESLILEAYNHNDALRRMGSCSAMYMDSGATATLFSILGSDWPKVSLLNALSKATDEQIEAAYEFCQPYIGAAKRSKLGKPTDNEPHAVQKDWNMLEARFERATTIGPDTTIKTRDGTKMGNAIIIRQEGSTSSFSGARDYIPIWLVETDFGNRVKLTSREIEERFTLGFHQPYAEWAQARFDKIRDNQFQDTVGGEPDGDPQT